MDGDSDVAPIAVEDVTRFEGAKGSVLTCSGPPNETYRLDPVGAREGGAPNLTVISS